MNFGSFLLILLSVTGCATSVARTPGPPALHQDSSVSECPARVEQANNHPCASDAQGHSPVCRYPQGECLCLPQRNCPGGAQRPMDVHPPNWTPPPEPWFWSCAPMVREDGCPGHVPASGTACGAPLACTYEVACYAVDLWQCREGRWTYAGRRSFGPPP